VSAPSQSWRERIAVHPAADLFPLLSDSELDALAKDIDENGMRFPLCFWRESETSPWELIDGRNRVAALFLLSEPEVRLENPLRDAKQYEASTDARAFAKSANELRRHISREQKNRAIDKELAADASRSDREIAKATGSSHPTVAVRRAEGEGRGKFTTAPTRADSLGRLQPAHRQPAASVSKEQQLRELREHARTPAALVSNTAAPLLLARQIEDFCSGLKGRRADVEGIDRQLRLRLAHGLLAALVIDPAELGPGGTP
jgi:hypothetical protein